MTPFSFCFLSSPDVLWVLFSLLIYFAINMFLINFIQFLLLIIFILILYIHHYILKLIIYIYIFTLHIIQHTIQILILFNFILFPLQNHLSQFITHLISSYISIWSYYVSTYLYIFLTCFLVKAIYIQDVCSIERGWFLRQSYIYPRNFYSSINVFVSTRDVFYLSFI